MASPWYISHLNFMLNYEQKPPDLFIVEFQLIWRHKLETILVILTPVPIA